MLHHPTAYSTFKYQRLLASHEVLGTSSSSSSPSTTASSSTVTLISNTNARRYWSSHLSTPSSSTTISKASPESYRFHVYKQSPQKSRPLPRTRTVQLISKIVNHDKAKSKTKTSSSRRLSSSSIDSITSPSSVDDECDYNFFDQPEVEDTHELHDNNDKIHSYNQFTKEYNFKQLDDPTGNNATPASNKLQWLNQSSSIPATSSPRTFYSYPNTNKLSQLGCKFIDYLTQLGFVNPTAAKPLVSDDRAYYCDLKFEVCYQLETFIIDLNIEYGSLTNNDNDNEAFKLPPSLFITNEQLVDYLKDKLILNLFKPPSTTTNTVTTNTTARNNFLQFEQKLNLLLKLKSIKCFINGLELSL